MPDDTLPYLKERKGILDTWLHNMLAETALQVFGHIIMGSMLQDEELNDQKNCVLPNETVDPGQYTFETLATFRTKLNLLLTAEGFEEMVKALRSQYRDALTEGPVVAGSLRALVNITESSANGLNVKLIALRERKSP